MQTCPNCAAKLTEPAAVKQHLATGQEPLCHCGGRLLMGEVGLVCDRCDARILPFGNDYGYAESWFEKFPLLMIVHRHLKGTRQRKRKKARRCVGG